MESQIKIVEAALKRASELHKMKSDGVGRTIKVTASFILHHNLDSLSNKSHDRPLQYCSEALKICNEKPRLK